MAQQTRIVDDIDLESDADTTVKVGLNGKWYNLDLSQAHADQLVDEVTAWTKHGTLDTKPRKEIGPKLTPGAGDETDWWVTPLDADASTKARYKELREEMRAWGREREWANLGDNGRLPRALCEAYGKWLNSQGLGLPVVVQSPKK